MFSKYDFLVEAISEATDDCLIWPYADNGKGYGVVVVNGKRRYAHVVALELTTPRPTGEVCSIKNEWVEGHKLEAAHGSCHNRLCFNPLHLSWKTSAENKADKKRDGTNNDNENHGACKLSNVDVALIRELYKGPQHRMRPKTGPTTRELAKEFGCSPTQIGFIVRGHTRLAL